MTFSLTFEQLDNIADAYIPSLGLLCALLFYKDSLSHGLKKQAIRLISLSLSISWAYLLMFIDMQLSIWPRFNLDYSTHTALSLCFICHLNEIRPRRRALLISSFMAYALLMMYQNYHSLTDIITTTICILPPLYWNNHLMTQVILRQHKY